MLRPVTWCVLHTAMRRQSLLWVKQRVPAVFISTTHNFRDGVTKQQLGETLTGPEDGDLNGKETLSAPAGSNMLLGNLSSTLVDKISTQRGLSRSSLEERIETLLSVGCTVRQISDRLTILKLMPKTVLRRAGVLKDLGCSYVTVDLLFLAGQGQSKLRESLAARQALDRCLCCVFSCTLHRLQELREEYLGLRQLKKVTPEEVEEGVAVLRKFGVTDEEIMKSAQVLTVKKESLIERMKRLDRLRKEGKLNFEMWPLQTVAESAKRFEYIIEKAVKNARELDGSLVSLGKIAQRLGVMEKDLLDASINASLPHSRAIERIDYLVEQGIASEDILSHIHVLNFGLDQLQASVNECRKVGIPSSNIQTLLSFLHSGHLPVRSTIYSRQKKFIAKLLGVTLKDLPSGRDVRPVWSVDRLTIKRNFDFLQHQGFSIEDIRSCIVLLGHDWKVLQEYYHSLWQRPELVNHANDNAWKDKKRVLSVLQHMIEKDMNFRSTVFVAEVEYGLHGTAAEEEKVQSEVSSELRGSHEDTPR